MTRSINEAAKTSFNKLVAELEHRLKLSPVIDMNSWQSTAANPYALRMHELRHEHFVWPVPNTLEETREIVKPYLPWADYHFEQERISGMPINPGETYKEWRYPASAEQHTDFEFSHSYAERYWPQYAGHGGGGLIDYQAIIESRIPPHRGIRHDYGDLSTLLHLLQEDITTRQAYLPIWFPEDLVAARKGERVPCTLGYHFLCRHGIMDVFYPMRSCDLKRHFRDDVYLTVRLLYFVLDALKEAHPHLRPGNLVMHISSLHCFEQDEFDG